MAAKTLCTETISRIEESPRDPEYGRIDAATVLIHFTDGSALAVEGHSYEEVSQSLSWLTPEDIRRRQAKVQGHRESDRLVRLKRQAWLALSCGERAAKRRAAREKEGSSTRAMRQMMENLMEDQSRFYGRQLYGDQPERTIRKRCPRCGEKSCENAPVEVIPAQRGNDDFWSGGFTVKVEGASLMPDAEGNEEDRRGL